MRVLISTVTAGAGHVQAAVALEEAWRRRRPDDVVERLDVLDFTPRLYRKAYSDGYLQLVKHVPELYARFFTKSDDPALMRRLTNRRRLVARAVARPFLKHVQDFGPDIILATHFLPLEALGGFLPKRTPGKAAKAAWVGVAVTDFEAHALWTEPVVDRYFVAVEGTKARLVARGVDEEKVSVTGIPISQRFSKKMSRAALRRRLRLDPRKPTLLILGGGFGLGPVRELLREMEKVERPIQALVVAGKNDALRRDLEAHRGRHSIHALGFVTNMEEMMTAADLIVSKPGGLTTSEALALGRPLLIMDPIPGQEAANSDFLLECGAAVKLSRVEDLPFKLKALLAPGALARLSANAKSLGRPKAALDIIDETLECWGPRR